MGRGGRGNSVIPPSTRRANLGSGPNKKHGTEDNRDECQFLHGGKHHTYDLVGENELDLETPAPGFGAWATRTCSTSVGQRTTCARRKPTSAKSPGSVFLVQLREAGGMADVARLPAVSFTYRKPEIVAGGPTELSIDLFFWT